MPNDTKALIFILLFMAVVVSLAIHLSSMSCEGRWLNSGYVSHFEAFGGCLIEVDGKIIP